MKYIQHSLLDNNVKPLLTLVILSSLCLPYSKNTITNNKVFCCFFQLSQRLSSKCSLHMIFFCHLVGEITSVNMKGRKQLHDAILDCKTSALAAKSWICDKAVFFNALWECDESQQDAGQSVNHSHSHYSNKSWKQIIDNDFTLNCNRKASPLTLQHNSQWCVT